MRLPRCSSIAVPPTWAPPAGARRPRRSPTT